MYDIIITLNIVVPGIGRHHKRGWRGKLGAANIVDGGGRSAEDEADASSH